MNIRKAIIVTLVFATMTTTSLAILNSQIREHYDFGQTTFNQFVEADAISIPGVYKDGCAGMSFTPSNTHYMNKIVLKVCKAGDPGTITMRIREMPPTITYRENTWTTLTGNCADGNWYTSGQLPEWSPPYVVAFSNYTIPLYARGVTWYCKDVIGSYQYTIPQSSVDGSTWVNISMMYEPTGDGYMYTYRTPNTWNTAMPGAGGDRWSPINKFYEEKLSFTQDMTQSGYLITEDDWRQYDFILKDFSTTGIKVWNDPNHNWNDWSTLTLTFPRYRVYAGTTYVITFSKNKVFTPSDGLYFLGVSYWNDDIEAIYPHYTRGAQYLSEGTNQMNEKWWFSESNYMWFQEYQ